jgi:hypothetical protein
MSDIHSRGHEIGYHASIDTYQDAALIRKEVALLRGACEQIGAKQAPHGSRQHYLRIQVPVTIRHLAQAGIAYDTTLGYADHAGFRCGTCWEHPFYDLQERRLAGIVERPLVVMDCSITDDQYMGLGVGEEALETMVELAGACRRVSGDFTLLWHNTRLILPSQRQLFEGLLAQIFGN